MLLRRKERILAYLRSGFGQDPLQSGASQLCRERLPQIGILYNTFREEEPEKAFRLDDITWSDLEMDEVFLRINQTQSYIGEQTLYRLLHSGQEPFFRDHPEMMGFLNENEEPRLDLSYRLARIGKRTQNYYIPELFTSADLLRPQNAWIFRVLQAAFAVTAALALILHTAPFLLAFVISMGVNFVVSALMKMKYDYCFLL